MSNSACATVNKAELSQDSACGVNRRTRRSVIAAAMTHVLRFRLNIGTSFSEVQVAALTAADRFWRENGKTAITRYDYGKWVRHYLRYCDYRGLNPHRELTRAGAERFSREFARVRGTELASTWEHAHRALANWAAALQHQGIQLPRWRSQLRNITAARTRFEVLDHYCRHLEQSGLARSSVDRYAGVAALLLRQLHGRTPLRRLEIRHIDNFIARRRTCVSLSTITTMCSGLRRFLSFLHTTGRHRRDLAPALIDLLPPAPVRPPRTVAAETIRSLLRAVDRATPIGRRDYALLLMMTQYGCGAGEVIRLKLEDIDWHGGRLRLTRPKTSVPIDLPLLPDIGRALADYLQRGRPRHCATRAVFVTSGSPHRDLASATGISARLRRYASAANIQEPLGGSHVLRHFHACRQLELGTAPKVIGDILGHVNPRSTEVYLRGAVARLRPLALAVPT
jgi:integrase/recombinase XerD